MGRDHVALRYRRPRLRPEAGIMITDSSTSPRQIQCGPLPRPVETGAATARASSVRTVTPCMSMAGFAVGRLDRRMWWMTAPIALVSVGGQCVLPIALIRGPFAHAASIHPGSW